MNAEPPYPGAPWVWAESVAGRNLLEHAAGCTVSVLLDRLSGRLWVAPLGVVAPDQSARWSLATMSLPLPSTGADALGRVLSLITDGDVAAIIGRLAQFGWRLVRVEEPE